MNLIETFISSKTPYLTADFGSTTTTTSKIVYGGQILYKNKMLRFVPFGVMNKDLVVKRMKFLLENIELESITDSRFVCRVEGNSIIFNRSYYEFD
jgi:hypothetical protein